MTRSISHSADVEAFAENYGLTRLTTDHLARMRELAPIAVEIGGKLPRPRHKSEVPAACFTPMPTSYAK